jgi:hypothetical protein
MLSIDFSFVNFFTGVKGGTKCESGTIGCNIRNYDAYSQDFV